jgi:glycosyltransferase 2 family protein
LQPRLVFQGYLLAFLPRYIPGLVWGYVSRNEWLARQSGISYTTSSVASLLEATTLLLTAATYGLFVWGDIRYWGVLFVISGIALWGNWHYIPRFIQQLNDKRWVVRVDQQQPQQLWWRGHVLYFGFWAVHGTGLFLLGQAFIPLPFRDLLPTIAAASLAWAIGFLVFFVPAGLGVRETVLAALLVHFTTLSPTIATALALLSRLGIVIAELLLLLMGLLGQFVEKIRQ